jgi:ribosomal protein S18 acetylase RimI-like enzyme
LRRWSRYPTISTAIRSGEGIVARQDENIVGFMQPEIEDQIFRPHDKVGESLYVHRLAVRRSHAGQGIPQALLH